ncbi:hypothetical protein NQ315_000434 [Exocentrus adspersus]|uniref:Protein quiver n=1 Tax=Exocentrus adspersus TaxID=1586481 RepID=A0AAV8VLF2_9CUCU|nr:hypothetical protein NQ315_000434 [Exocentrus adspersus]
MTSARKKMFAVSFLNVVLLVTLLHAATSSTLLCYDCDAERECEDPVLHNVRLVNCNKQYPDADGKIVCLTLNIYLPESRGFDVYKSGYYRGCRVIPPSEESNFCDNLKMKYSNHMVISSCNYCNTTRCVP